MPEKSRIGSREHLLDTARAAAQTGGAILRDLFGQDLQIRDKGAHDVVTNADLSSEQAILSVLQHEYPEIGVISEELGQLFGSSEATWIVDPLDGTNNFVLGLPQFSVSIALVSGDTTMLSVIYQPVIGTIWHALPDEGAFKNDQRIWVRDVDSTLDQSIIACIQSYVPRDDVPRAIQRRLRDTAKRVLSHWAPALDWCLLAEGKIDAVISTDAQPYDQIAGALLAQEAGALMTGFDGAPYTASTPRLIATASSELHMSLLSIAQGEMQKAADTNAVR